MIPLLLQGEMVSNRISVKVLATYRMFYRNTDN